jgi:hypothetical protein
VADNPLLHQKIWFLWLDADHHIELMFPFSCVPQRAVFTFHASKRDPLLQEAPFEIGKSTLDEDTRMQAEKTTFHEKRFISRGKKR